MKAARKGCLEIVRLVAGKEAKMQDQYGQTALMLAAESGHLQSVELLIPFEKGMQDKYGYTALMFAAKDNRVRAVELLIPFEARMQREGGVTALILATQLGRVECVRLLLPHEAGTRISEKLGAVHFAVNSLQLECAALLLADDAETRDVPAQMVAAGRGDARAMLRGRDRWMETICKHVTILHFAFAGGDARCMGLLMRDKGTRTFLASQHFDFQFLGADCARAIKCILPALIGQDGSLMSDRVVGFAFKDAFEPARALRPFCHVIETEIFLGSSSGALASSLSPTPSGWPRTPASSSTTKRFWIWI